MNSGREPPLPLRITLDDGRLLVLHKLLRVLPGKRLTGIGTVAGETVLAKLFVAPGSARRHWERECQGLAALRERVIPTPHHLTAGPLADATGYYLLTAYLAEAHSPRADDAAELCQVFALLGRLHAAGLVQSDAHLGNFLLHGGQALVIDGDEVRRAAGQDEFLRNLALLFAQLQPQTELALQAELLAAYVGAGGTAPDAMQLEADIEAARAARLADYLKKCLRQCTLFHVEQRWDRFFVMPRAETDFLAPLAADPDRWLAQGRPLKQGRTATLALVEHGDRQLVIKRYNIKSPAHALSRCWRPSRAWHSWQAAHRLEFLGIATPKPLAMIEGRFGPLRGKAWLITEYSPGETLMARWADFAIVPPPAELEAVGRLFAQLAAARISHGDLKASNLIWYEGRISLVDLDATVQHATPASFQRAWRRDCERFLRNWPPGSPLHKVLETLMPRHGEQQ